MSTIIRNRVIHYVRLHLAGFAACLFLVVAPHAAFSQILSIERIIEGRPENPRSTLIMSATSTDRLDFNGDAIADHVSTYSDPATGDFMRIVDGSDPGRTWVMRLDGDPDHPIVLGRHSLVGFYNLDGIVSNENPKELVFATLNPSQSNYLGYVLEDVIISGYEFGLSSPETQPLGIIAILIGILDRDRDGKDEVMLVNPDAGVTEIWGAD